jgi:DNA repair exonuclease SbcCD nuclease subunit
MTFRFIHSSDLHLGRRFANIPQPSDSNIRGRLMEARHAAISKLASVAKAHNAEHVLLAGDTFDTATPSAGVIRQALSAMADAANVTWWLLPGNHDNLRDGEPLWEEISRNAPPNVRAVTEAEPIDMGDGATLLPCPVEWRSAGVDPTERLMTMPSDESSIRLGLAHGGVTDFTESGDVIAPDRDRSARLEYLALGDWHGRMAVSTRVHYPGSPEQDRFKHGRPGLCLAVEIEGPGGEPRVTEVETGTFHWTESELPLAPRQDASTALAEILPRANRRDILMRVHATGWAGLADQALLRRAAEQVAPEFAFFEISTGRLSTQYDASDIDEIDRAGALRLAANALKDDAENDSFSPSDRAIASDALARLYSYVKEDAQ